MNYFSLTLTLTVQYLMLKIVQTVQTVLNTFIFAQYGFPILNGHRFFCLFTGAITCFHFAD